MASKLKIGLVSAVLMALIIFIVVMNSIGGTAADVRTAAGNLTDTNASGLLLVDEDHDHDPKDVWPLTTFFKEKGVILLAFMAGLTILFVTAVMKLGK